MEVSSLYSIELWFHVVTIVLLWPLYISQLLVFRFTHRRRILSTKRHLIWLGFLSMTIQTIRTVDPSSAFGRLSLPVQRSLYTQLGCILMYCVVLVVLATAKSLCVQLGRPVPLWFTRTLWGINIASHITAFPCIVANGIYFHEGEESRIMAVFAVTAISFALASTLTLIAYWFLYIRLRERIRSFLVTLERQEAKLRARGAPTLPEMVRARSLGSEGGDEEHASTADGAPLPPAPEPSRRSSGGNGQAGGRVSGLGGGVGLGAGIVGAGEVRMTDSPTMRDAGAGSPGSPGTPGGNAWTLRRLGSHAGGAGTAPNSPGGPLAPSTETSTPVTSPLLSPVPRRSTAAVAPMPLPNGATAPTISEKPALLPPSPKGSPSPPPPLDGASSGVPSSSQHESRVRALEMAVLRMNVLTVLITILLVGTVCGGIQNYKAILQGGYQPSVVSSPYQLAQDGIHESYRMSGAIQGVVNQVALTVLIWYAWSSTRPFMNILKRHDWPTFWLTLRFGVREGHVATRAEAYAPQSPQQAQQSKTGGGAGGAGPTSMLKRDGTSHHLIRVAPSGGGGVGGGTGAGGAPARGESGRALLDTPAGSPSVAPTTPAELQLAAATLAATAETPHHSSPQPSPDAEPRMPSRVAW